MESTLIGDVMVKSIVGGAGLHGGGFATICFFADLTFGTKRGAGLVEAMRNSFVTSEVSSLFDGAVCGFCIRLY